MIRAIPFATPVHVEDYIEDGQLMPDLNVTGDSLTGQTDTSTMAPATSAIAGADDLNQPSHEAAVLSSIEGSEAWQYGKMSKATCTP